MPAKQWISVHAPMCQLIKAEWCIYTSENQAIIGSDNGSSTIWCQAIIWAEAGLLLIATMGTNFSEIWIQIQQFS